MTTTYSAQQIANYCYTSGFRGNDLVTAVAIALAESGGDTDANSTTSGTDSYGSVGFFQPIPTTWAATAPAMVLVYPKVYKSIPPFSAASDPQTNCDFAYTLHKSQGWRPWATYNAGTYKQPAYWDPAVAAVTAANAQGGFKRGTTQAADGPGNGSAHVETGTGPNQVPQRTDSNNVWTYMTNAQWAAMGKEYKGTPANFLKFKNDLLNVSAVSEQTNQKAHQGTQTSVDWVKTYGWDGGGAAFSAYVGKWHQTADTARGNAINPLTQVVGQVESVASTLGDLIGFVNKLVNFVTDSNNWLRMGEFLAGSALLIMGLYELFKGTRAAQVAAGMGSQALKVGEVVAAA